MHTDLDRGTHMLPNMLLEFGTRPAIVGKTERLSWCQLGPDILDKGMRGIICLEKDAFVVRASGIDHNVISKDAWEGTELSHENCPWPEEEGDEHHGEGTTLGNPC